MNPAVFVDIVTGLVDLQILIVCEPDGTTAITTLSPGLRRAVLRVLVGQAESIPSVSHSSP
jgi:hypothetical protein